MTDKLPIATMSLFLLTLFLAVMQRFYLPPQDVVSLALIPANVTACLSGHLLMIPKTVASFFASVFINGSSFTGNMVFLVVFGLYVEACTGGLRLLQLFFAGAVAGAMMQVASDPASTIPLVGAGGAIAALLGYCAVSGNRLVRVVSLIWLSSVVTGKLLGWGDGFTAYWALLGGFAAGCVLESLPKRFIPAH